jgi:hypothetical protein
MSPASDIRYTNYENNKLAVAFDGRYFMAYVVGSEHVGVTISMEILTGVYPEVHGHTLKRIESYNKNGSAFGTWMLDEIDAPEKLEELPHSWRNLQERARIALQENRGGHKDLIGTLERTVERLDDLLAKTKQPSAWAEVILPVLEAASNEGISMDDILEAGYRKVVWLEKENEKAKK